MPDETDFGIKVTADYTAAGQAFDELLSVIDGMAMKATAGLRSFDAVIAQSSGGLLAMVANLTPVGRTVSTLISTLDGAVAAGRKLAEAFGAGDSFRTFERALSDLKASAGDVFAFIGGAGTEAFAQLSAGALGELPSLSGALRQLIDNATSAVRALQATLESVKPVEDRSTEVLRTQIAQRTAELNELKKQIEDFEKTGTSGVQLLSGEVVSVDNVRQQVNDVEAEIARLRAIMAGRVEPFHFDTSQIDQAIDSLRRQNRELQIQADTLGMTAAAAAQYRREMELAEMLRDPGPGGEARAGEVRAELEESARLRQQIEAGQAAMRAGQSRDRIFTGEENRVQQLEAQANAIGKTSEETSRLTELERILGQLRSQRVPIDDATRASAEKMAESYAAASEQLKTLQRQQQQLESYGQVFSKSMERAFSDWISGTDTNWRQLVNTMASDIAMLALRSAVLQPLFGGGGTQGGGLFGSLVSGLLGGGSGGWVTTTIPARATGGPVASGQPYLVGEAGPELFIPSADGAIAPNGAGRGATINMRIDLAGANGDETIARIAKQYAAAGAREAVAQANEGFAARQNRLRMLGA